jgi:lysophospholipase L1-like esterase
MHKAKAFLAATVLCLSAIPAQSQSNPATTPKDRLNEDWWSRRHTEVLAKVKTNSDAELILVGDSITQNYEKSDLPDENFQPTWQQFYAPRKALNLGYSGDATENVLWRLDHGEVDGLHPSAAMLLIGTNNTGLKLESAADTEQGIVAVVDKLQSKLPQTKILLLAILPSGVDPKIVTANNEINHFLATKYGPATGQQTGTPDAKVTYLDIGSIFYKDGKLNEAIFYDPRLSWHPKPLHPDTIGQRLMAEAIEPTLTRLMADSPRAHLASLRDINSAIIPVPRLEHDSYEWFPRHQAIIDTQHQANTDQTTPQIVLIGDSITHFWGGEPKGPHINGPKAWEEAFHGLRVLNMGFGWDRTQNVLWRLAQGELDGLHPKTIVLNIGTNNLVATSNARSNTPEEVTEAILAIVREVRRKCPQSRIIVMGIFPRNFDPNNALRAPILAINHRLSVTLDSGPNPDFPNTQFLDIGTRFLTPDGTLPKTLMNDGTHPTDEGYSLWAKALIEAGIRQ